MTSGKTIYFSKSKLILDKKELKKNILISIFSILIMLIFLEIGLRLFFPQKIYNECYEPEAAVDLNSHFGWFLKANYTACSYQPDTNKIIYTTHNSRRIRLNREIPYEKKDKKRIMLLGDSFVYGSSLDDSETLAYALQQLVGEEYEVIPIASVGYGTDQELLIFLEEGLKYSPDIVLLFFFGNDITNCFNPVQNYAQKPYFRLEGDTFKLKNYPTNMSWTTEDPNLTKKLSKKKPIAAFLLRFSHLYSLWYHKKPIILGVFKKPKKKDYFAEYRDSQNLFIEKEYTDLMEYGWFLITNLFGQFKIASKKYNFKFIILYIPSKHHVSEEYQDKLINQYYNIDKDFFQFNKISLKLSKDLHESNITYYDLYDLAKDNFDDFYFKTDLHWSPSGVQLTSEYLYDKLKKDKII